MKALYKAVLQDYCRLDLIRTSTEIKQINNKWEFQWFPQSDSFIHCFQELELDFEKVGFCGGSLKTRIHRKNPQSRGKNQQQTHHTYDIRNRTWATLVSTTAPSLLPQVDHEWAGFLHYMYTQLH